MAELTPITRIEYYLAKANGQDVPVPQAATRLEMYLRKIAGEEQDVPTPVTRLEMFLAKIAGEDVTTPTPVTRLEMFLDKAAGGSYDDLVAVTRLEMWLDGIQGGETGEQKTASGTAPLSFTALAHALISLTQYGKTVQDGTPTPSAPKDIVCNNGTLRMVDDELPSGFTRLQSIESDGTDGYVATGIVIDSVDTDVEIDYQFINTSATQPKMVWGYMDGASNIPRWGFGAYTSGWLGSPNVTATKGSSNSNRHTAIMSVYERSGVSYYSGTIDGTELYAETALGNVSLFEENVLPLILFARNNKGTAGNFANAKIFRFSVTEANVLTHDLVPCKDDNGVLGFYDLVTETFLAGTGTLTAGAADYSHAHIGVVGTPEVLSVWTPILQYTSADMSQGFGFTSTASSKAINVILPALPVGKYIVSVPDGFQANLRGNWAGGANVASWLQSQTVTISYERENYYGIAVRKTGGTADIAPADFDGVLVIEAATQTATAVNLLSVGDYADTQDIISGAVTRKVGIKVLDGTEAWAASTNGLYYLNGVDDALQSTHGCLCTHFVGALTNASSLTGTNSIKVGTNASGTPRWDRINVYADTVDFANLAAFKAYLAAQYAAGTPVIVLYPLAEETTEQVTAQSLHTTAGENVVSVVSNVDPVTLEAVYMGEASDE